MKKLFKRKYGLITRSVLCAVVLVMVLAFLPSCMDRSAIVHVEGVEWRGRSYSYASGEYTEGKTIAKGQGGWDINEVEQDPSHTFIVARSFLDQFLYVADDYTIPTSGKVTMAHWNNWDFIYDEEFLNAASEIVELRETSFIHHTDAIFALRENQRMKALHFAYEGCPVATEYQGYMGKINGEWVITVPWEENEQTMSGTFKCYTIPDKYASVLDKYFFE